MGFSEGVAIFQIIDDLRHIKLPKETREKVLSLHAVFKQGTLPVEDQKWLRRLYNRRSKQIRELHASYESVRITDAKKRRGSAKDKLLKARAKRLAKRRREQQLEQTQQELEELERESKDFGF